MNIIIAVNEKYIEPAKTMLYSLSANNDTKIEVHLLYNKLSFKCIQDLSDFLCNYCHATLNAIHVNSDFFKNAPKNKWWSEEMYYRLLAFKLLPESVKRALWLDADIIINGNISEFYNQNITGVYGVVCKGCNQTGNARLGLADDHQYFNSGVLLFNLDKLREDFSLGDVFSCIKKYESKLQTPDQDILNILFKSQVIYADPKIYNHETFGDYVLPRDELKAIYEKTKIIHFNGPTKPWNPKGCNSAGWLWWKYELQRGRKKEYIQYHMAHLPAKLYYQGREFYYIVLGQIRKLKRNS